MGILNKKPSRPVITGDFIQPGLCDLWTQEVWDKHFDELKELGMDTFIIQWIINTPNGVITKSHYPAKLVTREKAEDFEYSDMLEKCLKAAQERGIKVYVGLNSAAEWWSKGIHDREWNIMQSEIGNEIATEIYNLYKEKYPDALAGFYWWFEMYNGMGGKEESFAEMININLDYLTKLDNSMPFVISPFVRRTTSAEKTQEEWTRFFSLARFRKGDIFTMQDAIGAGHMDIELLDGYFDAIKKAADTNPNVEFWANNEVHIRAKWCAAPISRIAKQLNITDKYVTKHICFSYSHYYATVRKKPGNYHEKYLDYKNKGIISED